MPLPTVSAGDQILATDINAHITQTNTNTTNITAAQNTLSQPNGGSESGSYYLGGWSDAGSDLISLWMPTISRGNSPSSVSIDSSLQGPSNMSSPNAANADGNGFQIYGTSSGAGTNDHVAGHWTVHF